MSKANPSAPKWSPARPILCLVVNRGERGDSLASTLAEACSGGVDWVHLRDRKLEGSAWLEWAEELAGAARLGAAEVRILVNRRIDVALALGADGAHMGFDALEPRDARRLLGDDALLGVSTHGLAEIRTLSPREVDYVHLAPIYDPHSKPASRPALGPGVLAEACSQEIPVIAQGGLDPGRCSAVIRAGAAGIAVTGAILHAPDPAEAAARLRAGLDRAT